MYMFEYEDYFFKDFNVWGNVYDNTPPKPTGEVIDLIFEDGAFQVPSEKPRLGSL